MSDGRFTGRTFQIVLFASLALNLFLVGFLVARGLSHTWHEEPRGPQAIVERLTRHLSGADAEVMRAAFQANQDKLAAAFSALQQARREVRQRIAADPYDPDALVKAAADVQVKWQAFIAALQDTILPAVGKLSPEGRRHLLPGMGH